MDGRWSVKMTTSIYFEKFDNLVQSGQLPTLEEIRCDYHEKRNMMIREFESIEHEFDSCVKDYAGEVRFHKQSIAHYKSLGSLSDDFILMMKMYTEYYTRRTDKTWCEFVMKERESIMTTAAGKTCSINSGGM